MGLCVLSDTVCNYNFFFGVEDLSVVLIALAGLGYLAFLAYINRDNDDDHLNFS